MVIIHLYSVHVFCFSNSFGLESNLVKETRGGPEGDNQVKLGLAVDTVALFGRE